MQYVGLVKKLLWYGNISNTYILDFSYNRRPTHMKAYTFVFAKTHHTNHHHKSYLLANHEREKFYFAFASRVCLPLLLLFLRPARNPPLHPSNLSLPSYPFPFFFSFFFFFTSLIIKSIFLKNFKKKTL